jgi:hypothetical protein
MGALLQRPQPFKDRKVAGRQVARPDWTEIKVDQLMTPVGDYQEINLVLEPPYELDLVRRRPAGVQFPDGTIILPEVELLTPDGVTAQMKYTGSRGKSTITYRLKDETIKRDYDRIRIRADRELPLTGIYWTGITIKYMK